MTILWDPTIPFSKESVNSCIPDNTSTISQFNVAWNHKAGDLFFDVGYATPYIIREGLENLWNDWVEHLSEMVGPMISLFSSCSV